MTRQELSAMAEKWQAKADKAYMTYQETGMTRYDRECRNAEDLAEALRAAANAAEEHATLSSIRAEVLFVAHRADAALTDRDADEMAAILESIVSYAAAVCSYKRRERGGETP